MRIDDVRRITLGTFVRPAEETGGEPRVEGVYGYLVRHEHGLVLLDTGIGAGDEETEAWYRPQRVPLQQALAAAGVDLADLTLVANCHLHFDHCGGNPLLGAHADPGAARRSWRPPAPATTRSTTCSTTPAAAIGRSTVRPRRSRACT